MMAEWTELTIKIPCEASDTAAAVAQMTVPYGIYIEDYSDLEEEAPKIAHIDLIDEELLARDREHAVIHVYISPQENPAEALSFLRERLTALQIPFELGSKGVSEEDWANEWKKYFKPIRIGERLAVVPSWEHYEKKEEEIVLTIDPGMAFGTGTHSSTALCLKAAQRYVKKGDRVLDLGCGSGILSIAAVLLGASNATGVDIDPVAVRVAQENAMENGLDEQQFQVVAGNILSDRQMTSRLGSGYDILFANIVADVIIAMLPVMPALLKKGGIVIASGIIEERCDDVTEALRQYGFKLLEKNEEKGWNGLIFQKP